MKLTDEKIKEIIKLIERLRGDVTQKIVSDRVNTKVLKISSRQLFTNDAIKIAYEAAKSKRRISQAEKEPRLKREFEIPETLEQLDKKIISLEEKISIMYHNAVKLGIPPQRLLEPVPPIDFGNTVRIRNRS